MQPAPADDGAPQPLPSELADAAASLSLAYLRAQAASNEKHASELLLEAPGGASFSTLLALSNSARSEIADLQARAEAPLDAAGGGSEAPPAEAAFARAVRAWRAALAAIEAHTALAQQARQAASNLLSRDGGSAGAAAPAAAGAAPPPAEAPAPSLPYPPGALLAFVGQPPPLDAFPRAVHLRTQQWLAVYGEVQRLGLVVGERSAAAAGHAQRLATIQGALRGMRAHLLREDGAMPQAPLGAAEEAGARRELHELAASRGRAEAAAGLERALAALRADAEARCSAERARLPAAEAAVPQLLQAQAEAEGAARRAELARAQAAVEAARGRIALLEVADRVASVMLLRRRRWGAWARALRARQAASATLFPPPRPSPPRFKPLNSLAALGGGGGGRGSGGGGGGGGGDGGSGSGSRASSPSAASTRASSPSAAAASRLVKPTGAEDAAARERHEAAAQRAFAARVVRAWPYSEQLAVALEGVLRGLLQRQGRG